MEILLRCPTSCVSATKKSEQTSTRMCPLWSHRVPTCSTIHTSMRNYMLAGGFLHIDDNYGIRQYIEPQMKKVFPELDFVELPYTHEIFKKPYAFPNGLPKIHEHDNKPPQLFALIYEGRIVCIFTYECDLGDGWEDQRVHHDSQETREKALKMGANILRYVFTK